MIRLSASDWKIGGDYYPINSNKDNLYNTDLMAKLQRDGYSHTGDWNYGPYPQHSRGNEFHYLKGPQGDWHLLHVDFPGSQVGLFGPFGDRAGISDYVLEQVFHGDHHLPNDVANVPQWQDLQKTLSKQDPWTGSEDAPPPQQNRLFPSLKNPEDEFPVKWLNREP